MAKYWTPGQVKTRLGRAIGLPAAAEIHRQFVLHLAMSLQRSPIDGSLWSHPRNDCPNFSRFCPPAGGKQLHSPTATWADVSNPGFKARWSPVSQGSKSAVVLIGADCPCLSESEVNAAFDALSVSDVVLGPAADGGYYLVGLRGPWRDEHHRLFLDMPWSSEDVYDLTCATHRPGRLVLVGVTAARRYRYGRRA